MLGVMFDHYFAMEWEESWHELTNVYRMLYSQYFTCWSCQILMISGINIPIFQIGNLILKKFKYIVEANKWLKQDLNPGLSDSMGFWEG